jgi:hypothetical protein
MNPYDIETITKLSVGSCRISNDLTSIQNVLYGSNVSTFQQHIHHPYQDEEPTKCRVSDPTTTKNRVYHRMSPRHVSMV